LPWGAASVVAEIASAGGSAVAVDPAYALSWDDLESRARQDVLRGVELVDKFPDRFVWHYFSDAADHRATRLAALQRFIEHYPTTAPGMIYVVGEFPDLPFPNESFDLVLCSHFLFTYWDRLSFDFHLAAIREMVRLSRAETRIFPLLAAGSGEPYPEMTALRRALSDRGIETEVRKVSYEFQAGGDEMLACSAARPIAVP